MTLRSITLMLPSELITQLQHLVTNPDALHQFVIGAIEHELQRRQRVSKYSGARWKPFFSQMKTEGISVNPDEIWEDVRARSGGREVVL